MSYLTKDVIESTGVGAGAGAGAGADEVTVIASVLDTEVAAAFCTVSVYTRLTSA